MTPSPFLQLLKAQSLRSNKDANSTKSLRDISSRQKKSSMRRGVLSVKSRGFGVDLSNGGQEKQSNQSNQFNQPNQSQESKRNFKSLTKHRFARTLPSSLLFFSRLSSNSSHTLQKKKKRVELFMTLIRTFWRRHLIGSWLLMNLRGFRRRFGK